MHAQDGPIIASNEAEAAPGPLFRPSGARSLWRTLIPTACAVGYRLSPLRG